MWLAAALPIGQQSKAVEREIRALGSFFKGIVDRRALFADLQGELAPAPGAVWIVLHVKIPPFSILVDACGGAPGLEHVLFGLQGRTAAWEPSVAIAPRSHGYPQELVGQTVALSSRGRVAGG